MKPPLMAHVATRIGTIGSPVLARYGFARAGVRPDAKTIPINAKDNLATFIEIHFPSLNDVLPGKNLILITGCSQ
jgi:hypothetical protein